MTMTPRLPRRRRAPMLGLPQKRVDTPSGRREYALNSTLRPQGDTSALIIGLHGGSGDSQRFADRSGLAEAFAPFGLDVVFPQAGLHWADGRAALEKSWQADRVFIEQLVAQQAAAAGEAQLPWAIIGSSNGGNFAMRMACELAEPPGAIAAVVAAMPQDYARRAPAGRPVPLILVQATEDQFIPWGGGEVPQFAGLSVPGHFLSADDTVAFWLDRNKCSGAPRRLDGAIGQLGVEIYAWSGGADGADFWRVVLRGAGHVLLDRDPGARLRGSLEELLARFVTYHLDAARLAAKTN